MRKEEAMTNPTEKSSEQIARDLIKMCLPEHIIEGIASVSEGRPPIRVGDGCACEACIISALDTLNQKIVDQAGDIAILENNYKVSAEKEGELQREIQRLKSEVDALLQAHAGDKTTIKEFSARLGEQVIARDILIEKLRRSLDTAHDAHKSNCRYSNEHGPCDCGLHSIQKTLSHDSTSKELELLRECAEICLALHLSVKWELAPEIREKLKNVAEKLKECR
jgi:hypothetical protein